MCCYEVDLGLEARGVENGGVGNHLLVELEPRGEAFGVLVLQSEVPHLPEPDGLDHLQNNQIPQSAAEQGEPLALVQDGGRVVEHC